MSEQGKKIKPVVLVVLDGFGIAPAGEGNAIRLAKTPVLDEFIRKYPAMSLRASGEEVGLSWGEMGNSEVGHLNLGAGRVYYQTRPRIDRSISSGEFFKNPIFLEATEHVKKNKSRLHLIGLISQGGVHSMDTHCYALLELAKQQGLSDVAVHVFLDGRDTVYNAGVGFVTALLQKMKTVQSGFVASLAGRFYAMDRDHRWERTQKAYEILVGSAGQSANEPLRAIEDSYHRGVYDEEFSPTFITKNNHALAGVQDNDAVIFFNFRPDRMRQIVHAFVDPVFDKFSRAFKKNLKVVTMVEYERGLSVAVAFSPETIVKPLAEVLATAGLRQLHIAETEKYAHVTFFFNGTKEDPFSGEERVIIPSPRVTSYDQAPEISARLITERVIKELSEDQRDFYLVNFANPDMVAHTGNLPATIKAMEVVDECLGQLARAVLEKDATLLITGDHGNAEELINLRTHDIDKEHATNPVPLIIVGRQWAGQVAPSGAVPEGDLSLLPPVGILADVAPTILSLFALPQPPEMTGQSLIPK